LQCQHRYRFQPRKRKRLFVHGNMDLREILQRRLKKKSSNEKKPDPPTSDDTNYDHNNNNNNDDTKSQRHSNTAFGTVIPSPVAAVTPKLPLPVPTRRPKQPIELGTIQYCNITSDGRHGDYNTVLQVASQNMDKPILANFVEWSG
jgi:hypothetical protein